MATRNHTIQAELDTVDLVIYRGDDFAFFLEWQIPDWMPIVPDDWSVAAQVRADSDSPAVLCAFTTSIAEGLADEILRVNLSLPRSVTATLTRGGVWDLEMVDPNGISDTWVRGSVTLTKDVTRS